MIIAISVFFFVLAIPVIKDRKKICTPKRYGILAVLTSAMGISSVYIAVETEFNPIVSVISLAILALTLYVYILAHITPIDKTSEQYAECTEKQLAYFAAKRMIKAGIVGEIIYGIFTFWAACITDFVVETFEKSVEEIVPEMFILELLLMFMLGISGLAMLVLSFTCAVGIIPESALVSHGCIKFILVQGYPKSKKILLILLSLIPLINIIYGICLIKKISDGLTSDYI